MEGLPWQWSRPRDALTRTSSSGAFFFTCSLTAFTACATSAFSPIATDGIVSASAGRSSISHHQQASSRRPANHSTGNPTHALTAGVPCVGQESLLRLFRRPGHHLSGAIHHELRQSAAPPICPQNQAPRRRAIPLGPGHTERPTVCIESAKIASDRPASCSRRSPDQAKIRSCHRCTRRIRYRRQTACSTISITAPNNPRLTSIRLM